MIVFYRSASIAPGKMMSAMAFAREIAAFVRETSGIELKIGVPIGGNPNRIGWSAQYENLAALEERQLKLMSDPKYMEIVAKGADNFIAGSVRDEIWRIV